MVALSGRQVSPTLFSFYFPSSTRPPWLGRPRFGVKALFPLFGNFILSSLGNRGLRSSLRPYSLTNSPSPPGAIIPRGRLTFPQVVEGPLSLSFFVPLSSPALFVPAQMREYGRFLPVYLSNK